MKETSKRTFYNFFTKKTNFLMKKEYLTDINNIFSLRLNHL